MIDHLVGRPSGSWKRTQVFLVILFWVWRILRGNSGPPGVFWLRRANRFLKRFTPWQIIVSTLTGVYAIRNLDKILGLGAPEPLARLYSPSYYRATWISTGLDAGFATAMTIRPKWLRDVCSILFSAYYILYATEGDEKLRRYRAVPTVEMLRATWEKTTNPYLRIMTFLPHITIRRKILLPRPKSSIYDRPITAFLFFNASEQQLSNATELILDFPGGGFMAMNPEHHEERLRMWATTTGRPVLSIDYGKAPEYPYPFAIDEAFDTYRVLIESAGALVGMSSGKLNIIISGDSAGATLVINVVVKVLESNSPSHPSHGGTVLPLPLALVINYAALDFNFTSWMSTSNLRVLRSEQSSGNLPGLNELAAQKDHLKHISPLSMVPDKRPWASRGNGLKRRTSWKDTFRSLTTGNEKQEDPSISPRRGSSVTFTTSPTVDHPQHHTSSITATDGILGDAESYDDEDDIDFNQWREEDRPLQARVRYTYHQTARSPPIFPRSDSALEKQQQQFSEAVEEANNKATLSVGGKIGRREAIGTRLMMTSRTGYFQDRIVSPSMMRAMAILYIGPHRNPDFATDYYISPILTPSHLLAQFPPLLMQCGEKDPFVDDTVIFAGHVREAKRARKVELELAISGKSARFDEHHNETNNIAREANILAMRRERDKLASESEDDWVQMVIFSDWSHGYLQMPALMSEAKAVIEGLAVWMDVKFRRCAEESHFQEVEETEACSSKRTTASMSLAGIRPGSLTTRSSSFASEAEADDAGITFVARKHHDQTHSISDGIVSEVCGTADDGTVETARESSPATSRSDSPSGSGKASGDVAARGGGGGRAMGPTISESELMRRRRLLDAHIFE